MAQVRGLTLVRVPNTQNIQLVRRSSSAASSSPKCRVVVLGAGWGGFRVAKDLDKTKHEVTVVSPRNHFLFTPLLPSTTVAKKPLPFYSSPSIYNSWNLGISLCPRTNQDTQERQIYPSSCHQH